MGGVRHFMELRETFNSKCQDMSIDFFRMMKLYLGLFPPISGSFALHFLPIHPIHGLQNCQELVHRRQAIFFCDPQPEAWPGKTIDQAGFI